MVCCAHCLLCTVHFVLCAVYCVHCALCRPICPDTLKICVNQQITFVDFVFCFLYSELCSHMVVICRKYLLVGVAFPNLQQDLKLCVSKMCVNCQLLTCCLGDNRFSSICNFLPIWISVTVVCDRQLCCCGGSQTRTGPELTNYSQLLPLQVARTELSSLWEAFTDRTIKGYLDFFIKHVYDCPAMLAD